jgi:spermidine synthase
MIAPAFLSFVCGFSSLSIEILWIRLYGFAEGSTPAAFGFVLTAYLIGIALGARLGGRACLGTRSEDDLWMFSLIAVLLSAVTTLALPLLFARMALNGFDDPFLVSIVVACASSVLAFVFPIAHHLGAGGRGGKQGRRFATVYTANVLGAALGPLVTGYVLLQTLTLQQTYVCVALIQLGAAIILGIRMRGAVRRAARGGARLVMPTAAGLTIFVMAIAAGLTMADPHTLIQEVNYEAQHAKTVIENRHGVITIFPGDPGDDVVFGGNVYDGRTNLDPERNTNGLQRPLLLAALQPEPRRVLMVGLSIGTWLTLAKEFPGVQQIDVVEINPGYLQAAQAYPAQARALLDARVHVAVDDARRWLRLHKDRRYDLVIMNTTWHWRANVSLLLSAEFLRLVKSHMTPGAVMAFNATGSGDAFYTASTVFDHAYRYTTFVYAADFDFRSRKDRPATRDTYRNLRIGDRPFFSPGSPAIDKFIQEPFRTVAQDQKRASRPFELITDENMISEFKYGRPLR